MPLDYQIAEHTLDNGLRVIVSEDHSVPIVTVCLLYTSDAADE